MRHIASAPSLVRCVSGLAGDLVKALNQFVQRDAFADANIERLTALPSLRRRASQLASMAFAT
jgi:hypothetical protein